MLEFFLWAMLAGIVIFVLLEFDSRRPKYHPPEMDWEGLNDRPWVRGHKNG